MYIQYAVEANAKKVEEYYNFKMKMISFGLPYILVLRWPCMANLRYQFKNAADVAVFVVSSI